MGVFSVDESQPSATAVRRIRTVGAVDHGRQTTTNRQSLSFCGKVIVVLLGVGTLILLMGIIAVVVSPELPSVTLVGGRDLSDVALSFANPNEKGLLYSNVTLTTYYYYNSRDERVSAAASVSSPEFDQNGGGSRTLSLRFDVPENDPRGSEVEIELRARVRYGGKVYWPAKAESDIRVRCWGLNGGDLAKGNPICSVDGFWRTSRMIVLGFTLLVPFLVVVILSFNTCCITSHNPHHHGLPQT